MRTRFATSVLLSDLACLALGLAVGSWVAFGTPVLWRAELVGQAAGEQVWPFAVFMLGGATLASYLIRRTDQVAVPRPSYGRAVAIVGLTLALTSLALVVSRVYFSRPVIVVGTGVWLGGALAHRAWRRRRPWTERMVIITREKSLAADVAEGDHADVIAVIDPYEEPPGSAAPEGTSLIVDLRAVLSEEMAQFVSSCNVAGLPIRALVSTYEEHTGRLPLVHLAEGWELTTPVSRNVYAPWKRPMDVALVLLTAPLWLVLFAVTWVWIRLDSRGGAIYRQDRIGRDRHRFTLYKFRTMVEDAEANGPQFAAEDDARLTRAGRWLRRVRLDEIPQLWNVLRGDLSLVGPRPERPMFVERYEELIPFYSSRHLVRPGITGWAQVNHGYADDDDDTITKLTYDLYYVKHMSLWLDLTVLGKSIWTVLSGFGAR